MKQERPRSPQPQQPPSDVHVSAPAPSNERGLSETVQVSDAEFPTVVYASVVLAFVWVLIASWLMFGSGSDVDLDLGIATVLFLLMLGIPFVLGKVVISHNRLPRAELRQFLTSDVEIATGRLSGSQAWVQVLLIPAALAFAATVIGAIRVLLADDLSFSPLACSDLE
jgi:hypothetical protein